MTEKQALVIQLLQEKKKDSEYLEIEGETKSKCGGCHKSTS